MYTGLPRLTRSSRGAAKEAIWIPNWITVKKEGQINLSEPLKMALQAEKMGTTRLQAIFTQKGGQK